MTLEEQILAEMNRKQLEEARKNPQPTGLMDRIGQGFSKMMSDQDFKDRMIIGLQGMSTNPNQALIEMAQDNIKRRRDMSTLNKQANRTIEFLRARGVPEAELQALKDNPSMLMEYAKSYLSSQFRKPTQAPTSVREYEYAVKHGGYTGSYNDFMKQQATLQGGGKLTEGESTTTGFYSRASEANKILDDLDTLGTDQAQNIAKNIPIIGNYFLDPNFQKLNQAQNNFLFAVLRKESGAVISPDEIATYGPIYFPVPGDAPGTIEQKRKARQLAVEALKIGSGRGAGQLQGQQPTAGSFQSPGGATVTPM
jgi:hypothetical protein